MYKYQHVDILSKILLKPAHSLLCGSFLGAS